MEQFTPEKLLVVILMACMVLIVRTLYANRDTIRAWLGGNQPLFHVLVGYREDMSSDEPDGIETPDNTAVEPVGGMPIPPNEIDIIRALAQVRDDSGKYKYSANEIDAAIKMNRNDVLKIVREERSGKAETPDTYQVEPTTPRKLEFARTLPDGKVVRVDQWGVEWVQQDNQLLPVDMYIAHFLTPQAA